MQPILHPDELLDFAFHQPADRHAGPRADDLGDVFLVDLFLEHLRVALQVGEPLLSLANPAFRLRDPAVLQLRGGGIVARALRGLDVVPEALEFLLARARVLDGVFLLLPVAAEPGARLLQIGQLALDAPEPFGRGGVGLLPQRLGLDLELHHAPLDLVEFGGHRVDLHAQPRRGLVHQVDGLVGEEPVRDVALREHRGRHQRGVLQTHAVVDLVALAQAAEDADRVFDGRLADHHGLEPALEGGVLFDVLAVLVQRRRADRVQLAARQHRLEHVGRVDGAFGGARPDHRVQFVDEEHDLAVGVGDFLQHRLQALFELAAVLRAGDQRAHVEADDALVLEAFRHVAAHDALGEALDDGGLADAGLADEDRVVLRAAREHLDDAADLLVAADDRVELAGAGEFREVAAVPLERLVLALGVLVGHPLGASNRLEGLEDPLAGQPAALEEAGGFGPPGFGRDRQQQVLGADVLVLHLRRFGLGRPEDGAQPGRRAGRGAAVGPGQLREGGVRRRGDVPRVEAELAHDDRRDALGLRRAGRRAGAPVPSGDDRPIPRAAARRARPPGPFR